MHNAPQAPLGAVEHEAATVTISGRLGQLSVTAATLPAVLKSTLVLGMALGAVIGFLGTCAMIVLR